MLILVKLILVAFAVIGQHKLFPEDKIAPESELESIVLPEENPELVLARRAMIAEGLCRTAPAADSVARIPAADWAPSDSSAPIAHGFAESCN